MKPQYIYKNGLGTKEYFSDKEMVIRHREDGPAVEWAGRGKQWFINGNELTEAEFMALKAPCNGKKVVVDGVEYTLKA